MTPDEAQKLLAACAAFDNRQPSQIAKRAWAKALHDVPLDQDAFDAVASYYGTPPKPGERLWIQPGDVRAHRKLIREERLANFVFESDSDDDDRFYLARYRAQLDAVASGREPPPSEAPALTGGPHPSVAKALDLDQVGREVPDAVAEVKRQGPLGQECPECAAPIGRPCRIGSLGKERRKPHRVRVENARRAAAGLPPVDMAALRDRQEAEFEQKRAASRQALEDLARRSAAEPHDDAKGA